MNPPASSRRHRVWPWILGLALSPFVAIGLLVASALRLNGDATVLREEIMAASGARWHTQVQLTIPPALVRLARNIVWFVHDVPPEAREVLRAVRFGSVGVYERSPAAAGDPACDFIAATDQVMARRGWARTVGVVDGRNTVLIYLPEGRASAQPSRVCLAVCDGAQLVVVAAGFNADQLSRFIVRQMGRERLTSL